MTTHGPPNRNARLPNYNAAVGDRRAMADGRRPQSLPPAASPVWRPSFTERSNIYNMKNAYVWRTISYHWQKYQAPVATWKCFFGFPAKCRLAGKLQKWLLFKNLRGPLEKQSFPASVAHARSAGLGRRPAPDLESFINQIEHYWKPLCSLQPRPALVATAWGPLLRNVGKILLCENPETPLGNQHFQLATPVPELNRPIDIQLGTSESI